MPESLATSKRKFYKFLDQLSSPSPKSTPTTTITTTTITTTTTTTTARPQSAHAPASRSAARPVSRLDPSQALEGKDQDALLRPTSSHRPTSSLSVRPSSRHSLRPTSSASTASLDSFRMRVNPLAVGGLGVRNASIRRVQDGSGRPMSVQIRSSMLPPARKRRADGSGGEAQGEEMEEGQHKKPYFTPWSHEEFLGRLRTFAPVTTWFPKPEGVGEVLWAKRGWECVGPETVGCRGCGKRVVVDFSPSRYAEGRAKRRRVEGGDREGAEDGESEDEVEFENSFETALVAKYAEMVVEGHGEGCLWRKSGCKDDIYHLPVVMTAWWQTEVRDSFASVVSIKDDIEQLRIGHVDATPSAEKIFRDLPDAFFTPDETRPNSSKSTRTLPTPDSASGHSRVASVVSKDDISPSLAHRALEIALTGWHATTESHNNLLACTACFQRIGLWMYQSRPSTSSPTNPDPNSTTEETTSPNPNGSASKVTVTAPGPEAETETEDHDLSAIDLVELHREHCPYRNGASQAATGDYKGQPAWRIQWNVAARYADEQRRRSGARFGVAVRRGSVGSVAGSVAGSIASQLGGNGTMGEGQAEGGIDGEKENTEGTEGETLEKRVLSREEVARLDKERVTKLRRLKSVLGIKFRMPSGAAKEKAKEREEVQG
ncbi:hypothetical protein CAC42_2178 [Sphaceloma murrayae]|uniref:Zf-C3HC-domain-containing protein n=1 Tax=Sphaceloma murrayae TaxID=2082308 RepID=A0A2K1QJ82_9PEZI|nr:hypothetical protein CAC42_2178 [Sphaceloma murrayae]